MTGIPVAVQADIDQDKARLRDLVAEARRHHHNGCTAPDQCPGRGVAVRLVALPQRNRDELLLIAISQLASGRPAHTAGAPAVLAPSTPDPEKGPTPS